MKRVKGMLAVLVVLAPALAGWGQTLERHSFTNLNLAIPDGTAAGLSDTETFTSGLSGLSAVRVKVKIDGRFNGDLYAYVRHINSQTTNFCVLLNRPGRANSNAHGYSDTGVDVTFDSAAANDIHNYRNNSTPPAGSPLSGTWQPDGRKVDPAAVLDSTPRSTTLTSFIGVSGSGEWTLFVADIETGATNQLTGWELELVGAALPPVSWTKPADIGYGTALGPSQLNATAGVPGSFLYNPASGAVMNAGLNQVLSATFSPTDTVTYSPAVTNVTINVIKAPLTITAVNKAKAYGAAIPVLTASYSGFVLGQGTSVLTTPVQLSTPATPNSPAGNYPINATSATASNYSIAFVAGTLTISKGTLTGSLVSSANPSLPGQQVSFTDTLTPVAPVAGIPSGSVQFRVDGSVAGSVPLINGVATFNAALSLGNHTLVAEYPGDGNFTGVTNSLPATQLVNTPPIAGTDTLQRYATNGVKVDIATLLSNDSDADGDTITFQSFSPTSAHAGTLTQQDNWIYYQPAAGYAGADSFTYTISDGRGSPVVGAVNITIKGDGPAANLAITDLGNGTFRLRFSGIPLRSTVIQFTPPSQPFDWQQLTSGITDASGIFDFVDAPPNGINSRFYRSLYP